MDGRTLEFTFDSLRDEDDPVRSAELQRLEDIKNLIVELDDRVMLIPLGNVRSASLTPPPAMLPSHIVRGQIVG
jgi:hypothetical protein